MEWFFDGLGTEIISVVLSLIIGGLVGYKIGVKRATKQKQLAGNSANQKQQIEVDAADIKNAKKCQSKTTINQIQKAGENSTQTQIGEIHNVRK